MKPLLSLFLALVLITLTGCQNFFSPEDPNVASPNINETQTELEAWDLKAENWQTLEGEGISLSLPETYRGGNPTRDLIEIESALNEIDENYGKRLQAIKQNLDHTILIAFDTKTLEADSLTNVNVVQQSLSKKMVLDRYLSEVVKKLQPTHNIQIQAIINNNENKIAQIVANTTTDEGVTIKQLFYLQPQEDTVLITTYTTPESEYQGRLPNFETSIASQKKIDR